MSTQYEKIMKRLGRNNFDRGALASISTTRGELYRGRSVKADHKRSLAKQFGYPEVITMRQHYDMSNRNPIAYNLCYEITRDCWREPPIIYDGDEDPDRRKTNPTEFEKAIDEHFERLNVFQCLEDLDYLQRPMRYAGLVAVTSERDESTTTDELVRLPTPDYLLEFRPLNELQLYVSSAGQNPNTLNYGKPIMYQVRTNVAGSTNEWENSGYNVHATRVYAYGEGAIGNSIYGVPALEASFEALMDADKVRGSAAEGSFQNSSNKYAFTLKNGTQADGDAIAAEMEDFDNEISRSMMLGEGLVQLLQTQLQDPLNPWTISVNAACAAHSKPMKVVIGMQTGERASTEDIRQWNRVVMDRQNRECTRMITGLIKFMQDRFTFAKESNYINVVWRDLNESTAEQQAELALKRVQTNKEAVAAKMPPVYTTEFIQSEAGAPIVDVLDEMDIDIGGEDADLAAETK